MAPRWRRPPNGSFEFVAFKTTGTNPGYDVKDASGRLWSVKLGIEAQSEVTTSRILWAMGFPQPATYFVRSVHAHRRRRRREDHTRASAPTLEQWRPAGEWSWYENPFVDTQPFRGLIVAQLVLNNWDLKTVEQPHLRSDRSVGQCRGGSSWCATSARRSATRSSSGCSRCSARAAAQGSKNDVDDFEQQGFIEKVDGNKVELRLSRHEPGARRHASPSPT